MTEEEKDKYIGYWHSIDFLFRDLVVGDLVMVETFDEPIIVEIHEIDENGVLWTHSGHRWIIPYNQIIAVREDI